jgi:hypothetical protein
MNEASLYWFDCNDDTVVIMFTHHKSSDIYPLYVLFMYNFLI